MPRLPPTPHSMEANEPCLGRWVHDDASGLEGLVIEVKTGGWRVVLSVDGNSVNRRSGALEYAAGEPPAELRGARVFSQGPGVDVRAREPQGHQRVQLEQAWY